MDKMILGICGSPRKGRNTDLALQAALTEAGKLDGIQTDILYLGDYKNLHDCIGCFSCCSEKAKKENGAYVCPVFHDDMSIIAPKLLACDGLILASPVYFGTVTATLKRFMDRTEGFLRYGQSKYKYGLQHKVGGAIAVGGNRNGGEEFTLQTMHYYFMIHDMIVVGSGGQPTPGCYIGGGATTWPNDKSSSNAILNDKLGYQSCKNLGRNVAETVLRISH